MPATTKSKNQRSFMRNALCVGINYYQNTGSLTGCVNDAKNVANILATNEDGSQNFNTEIITAANKQASISRKQLKNAAVRLFRTESDIALFYFSGHGHLEKDTGGYLVTSDSVDFDDGLAMYELIGLANSSPAKNKFIILDCCFSATIGSIISNDAFSMLGNGLVILAASQPKEFAYEADGAGIFTTLLVEALKRSGASLTGEITATGIFSFIDNAMAPSSQRPVFKSNISGFVSMRQVAPSMPIEILRRITTYFREADSFYPLNPSFEITNHLEFGLNPIAPYADAENVETFKVLQKLQSVGLVIPVGAPYMYFAAMMSKGCKLTVLGKHYWRLVKEGRI
jgi:hypothetical protein